MLATKPMVKQRDAKVEMAGETGTKTQSCMQLQHLTHAPAQTGLCIATPLFSCYA